MTRYRGQGIKHRQQRTEDTRHGTRDRVQWTETMGKITGENGQRMEHKTVDGKQKQKTADRRQEKQETKGRQNWTGDKGQRNGNSKQLT